MKRPQPVSAKVLEERAPPPPESLIGALQDRVHATSGLLLDAQPLERVANSVRVGDHKRKAIPVAPARIFVTPDDITVVVPDVLGKNESHKTGKGGRRFTSPATEAFRLSVELGVDGWRGSETTCAIIDRRMSTIFDSQAMDGAWRLEVIGVWPRQRATIDGRPVDFICPMGDADAAIPQALDALQRAGILDDDARVVEVRAWNLYRKDQRATIIRLVRVPDLAERDAAIAHLAEHVPADSPPTPKKPRAKSSRRNAASS